LLARARGANLPSDTDQGIFGRLVAVAGREDRRPLDVRIVVGAAAREVDGRHAQLAEDADQPQRLGQIVFQGIVFPAAKTVLVGQQVLVTHGLPHFAAGLEGRNVKRAQPHADQQVRVHVAKAGHDRAQDSRAAVEVAAEPAGTDASAQELVQQIAVTGLDVDKLEADLLGQARRGDVSINQPLQVVIGPDDGIVLRSDAELGVQQRMVIRDSWLQLFRMRAAEPARMGQLQPNQQIVGRAEMLAVGGGQFAQQRRQAGAVFRRGQGLIRVGSAIALHGRRLAAPDQLGTAEPEMAPAAQGVRRRRSVAVGVPTFHRMDAPAVAHTKAADLDGSRQRRALLGRENLVVDGQIQGQLLEPRAKGLDRLQLRDFRVRFCHLLNLRLDPQPS